MSRELASIELTAKAMCISLYYLYEENHIIKKVFRSALKVLFFSKVYYVVHEIKYKTSKEIRADTSIPVYIEHTYSYDLVILRLG